jgi:CheY-like chemotaxis protein
LPAIRAEAKRPKPEKAIQAHMDLPTARTATILIVDDNESVLKVTQALVQRMGHQTLVAHNGREAIELARTFDGEIDLTLLDMGMPVMNGAETYPLLVQARPKMQVILFSGYDLDTKAQAVLDAGARAFIQKPFQMSVLRAEIRKALEPVKKDSSITHD